MRAPEAAGRGRFLETAATAVLCLAALAVPLAFLPSSIESTLPKLLALVLCAGLLCTAMGLSALRGRLALPRGSLPPVAALMGAAALTVVRAAFEPPSTTGIERVLLLASGVAVFTAVLWLLHGDARRRDLLFAAVLAGGYSAMLSAFLRDALPWGGLSPDEAARFPGTLCNANLLGSYAGALAIPGLLFLHSRRWSLPVRLAAMSAHSILVAAAMARSGTRASFVALAAAGILTGALFLRNRRRAMAVPAVLLAGMLAALPFLSGRLVDPGWDGSTGARLVIWKGAAAMFLDRPLLGRGPGAVSRTLPLYRPPDFALLGATSNTAHAHGEPLEIAVETGIAGLLAWGLAAFLWLRAFLRHGGLDPVTVGAASGAVFLAVESVVSIALRWPASPFLLAFLSSTALSGAGSPRRLHGLLAGVPAIAAGAALLWPGLATASRITMASRHLFEARTVCLGGAEALLASGPGRPEMAGRGGELCSLAVAGCRRAIELTPWEPAAWYTSGNARLAWAAFIAMEGAPGSLERAALEADTALAEYDTLAGLAEDFADMRFNRLQALAMLGRLDEACGEAAHLERTRRDLKTFSWEYVHWTAPLCGTHGAWLGEAQVWLDATSPIGRDYGPQTPEKAAMMLEGLQCTEALACARSGAEADSLASGLLRYAASVGSSLLPALPGALEAEAGLVDEGLEIVSRIESGDTAGLYAICRAVVDTSGACCTFHSYALLTLAAQRGDTTARSDASAYRERILHFGLGHLGHIPGGGDHLVSAVELALAGGGDADIELLESSFEDALYFDFYGAGVLDRLDALYRQPSDRGGIEALGEALHSIGGPMASLGTGSALVPGGCLDRMTSMVEAACASSPSAELASLRARLYTRLMYICSRMGDETPLTGLREARDRAVSDLEGLLGVEGARLEIASRQASEAGIILWVTGWSVPPSDLDQLYQPRRD